MIASQREALPHTDITQLLILGKSSDATDVRDMVYAFYGLTYLTSSVTYSRTPEWLFVEICHMYITALRYVASYDSVHGLTEQQKIVPTDEHTLQCRRTSPTSTPTFMGARLVCTRTLM